MPSTADLPQALIALDRFSREITRLSSSSLGLPGNVEIQVVLEVHFRPGITPGAIAATTGLRGSEVSRALRNLEHGGLVARVPAPFDGRTSNVRLTRKGRTRISQFDAAMVDLLTAEPSPVTAVLTALGGEADVHAEPVDGLDAAIALSRVGAAFVAEVNAALTEFGIEDFTARSAITLIDARESLRPTQMGEELGLSSSGASDLLDRLERAGLVDRRHGDPDDRRAVTVRLTPRGERAAATALSVFAHHIEPIAAALSLTTQPAVVDGAVTA